MASVGNDGGEQITLNIMPMLDIFSILILFLLMSFSTDPVSHDLNESTELPESATLNSLDEVPAIVLGVNEILVNGKKIVTLINKDVQERDSSQGAIHDLFLELEKLAEANKRFSKTDKKKPGTLTVEIDKKHKFKLLKRVMLSAQQADFVKFKLMVSKLRG
ncbi:MAG: biopolymer transporter ExbD [Oligoflexales bacterium]|nr:biopolymer transporter ExbD [Oligoflexales bacterium]